MAYETFRRIVGDDELVHGIEFLLSNTNKIRMDPNSHAIGLTIFNRMRNQ